MRTLLFLLGGKKPISTILAFALSSLNITQTFNARMNLNGIFDTPVLQVIQSGIPVTITYKYSLIITTEGNKWLHKGAEKKVISFQRDTLQFTISQNGAEKVTVSTRQMAEQYLSKLQFQFKLPQNVFEGSVYSLHVTAHLEYQRGSRLNIPVAEEVWQYYIPVFKKEGNIRDLLVRN